MEESLAPMGQACCEPRRTSVHETLQNKKETLTRALADVQAAIDALDANPEVSKVLELLARAGTRM